MKCPKCEKLVLHGSTFCDVCGAKIIKERKCFCGTTSDGRFNFCPNCGKDFETNMTLFETDLEHTKKERFEAGAKTMLSFLENNLYDFDYYNESHDDD